MKHDEDKNVLVMYFYFSFNSINNSCPLDGKTNFCRGIIHAKKPFPDQHSAAQLASLSVLRVLLSMDASLSFSLSTSSSLVGANR